jgi:hypothetical protein
VSFLLNFILDTHTQVFLSRQCLIETELEIASSGFELDRASGKPEVTNARQANRPLLSLSGKPARPLIRKVRPTGFQNPGKEKGADQMVTPFKLYRRSGN